MKHRVVMALYCFFVASSAVAEVGDNSVTIKTNLGDITLVLNAEKAPAAVANFLRYVDTDGYQNTIFHRVMPGFMIQGGGVLADLSSVDVGETIVNEAQNGLKNVRGSIAMARFAEIDSAGRQFFINMNDNVPLDHSASSCTREDERRRLKAEQRGLYRPQGCKTFGYAVFGHVIEGMDVLQKIEQVETRPREGYYDLPVAPVTILEIVRSSR